MRLPATKVHRAFRALDPFTDEQCRGYVKRAIGRHLPSMILMGCVAVLAALATAVGGIMLLVFVGNALFAHGLADWTMRHGSGLMVMLATVLVPVGCGLIAGFLVRDVWMRWAIGKELRRTTCPKCDYQLLGLPTVGPRIRCPECGVETRLDLLKLSTADLAMPGPAAHPPLAPPPSG